MVVECVSSGVIECAGSGYSRMLVVDVAECVNGGRMCW